MSSTEYDLILSPDINTRGAGHTQWFFFMVRDMRPGLTYTFNIVNMEKNYSIFDFGMRVAVRACNTGAQDRHAD